MAASRSPNYPFIPLDVALERARVIWREEGKNPVAPATAVSHWGYSEKSSGGRQTVGALRAFGLIEGRGTENLRLTPLAQSILVSEPGAGVWRDQVHKAALTPPLHQEIWQKYEGNLPSDANLRYSLVMDRGFTEAAAGDFITELRRTFDFAGLTGETSDNLSDEDGDKPEDGDGMSSTLQSEKDQQQGGRRAVQLPYSPTAWATLQASFPVTADEWDQMLAVLTAMKPALTERDEA